MSPCLSQPRGMYFDEFKVGQRIVTAGRTITEADVVNFAGLSGDFNQIHTDAVYSQNGPFGQRIAHGLLVLAVANGLAVQTGVMEGTVVAFREITEWKFVKPVFLGDTVHAELAIVETKEMRRIGAGAVILEVNVKNQEEEVVMKGQWTALIALRSE